jgi:3'-phosphoadenosine 5'-phosphosulfate (PAPS) 3'-phosphatase
MPWDFAAGQILVEEAGGALARPDGTPLDLEPGPVRGGNRQELLDELRGVLEDPGSD